MGMLPASAELKRQMPGVGCRMSEGELRLLVLISDI
jgi:hypothetical protein